jgi:ribonuclease BN (tRNA processing enzyme)
VNVTEEVIALQKTNGSWQAKSAAEQEAWIRHMNEEHVTPEQVGRMASAAGVKTVVLTHFTPTLNRNDDYQRFVEATKKVYSGQVLLAKDLMQF